MKPTLHEPTAHSLSLPLFLPLHVQDAFLINGRRMDGLTEGPDNNGWSTGHKCSYWEDLWAPAHRRLSSIQWDDFSKLSTDGSKHKEKLSLSCPSALLINQISLEEASSRTAPGKRHVDCEYDKNGKTKKCKRRAKLLKRIRGVEKSGKIFLASKIRILCGSMRKFRSYYIKVLLWINHHRVMAIFTTTVL